MSSSSEVLSQLGSNFITKVIRIAFEAAFYGVYIMLISASTTILCRRGLRSPWKTYVLCITLVMFLGSSLFMAMDIADIVLRFKIIFLNNSSFDVIQERMNEADTRTQSLTWTGEILFVFMLILGDSVVLWRTWTIYYGKREITIIPILTWLGSLVTGLYELGCDVKTHWAFLSSTPSAGSQGAESCAKSDLSSFTLSYATNLICTCLIFFRAWSFRKCMRRYLGSARVESQAEKILVLLIESGLLYLTIYTLQAIPIYAGYSPGSQVAWEAINAIIQQAFGMYPTAIVVLVELQRSLWETDEVSRELTRMEFAENRQPPMIQTQTQAQAPIRTQTQTGTGMQTVSEDALGTDSSLYSRSHYYSREKTTGLESNIFGTTSAL